jgi:hypothetical protein
MGKVKRRGPSVGSMQEHIEHSEMHRGESGKYGSVIASSIPFPEWKPTADEHEICIVPYYIKNPEKSQFRNGNPDLNRPFTKDQIKDGDTWDYKLSLLVHSNIGPNKDQVLCLKTFKGTCPICEERQRLYDEDPDSKEAGSLGIGRKALYLIICFDSKKERKKGIQYWLSPQPSIEEELVSRAKDRKTGEYKAFGIPDEGWNIIFEKTGTGLNTEYTGIDIVERDENSELSEKDIDEIYSVTENCNLEDHIIVRDYSELSKMLHGHSLPRSKNSSDETPKRSRREREKIDDEDDIPDFKSRKPKEKEDDEAPNLEAMSKEELLEFIEENGLDIPRASRLSERILCSKIEKILGDKIDAKTKDDDEEEKETDRGLPKCFGLDFNTLDACEDCPDGIFEKCMEASEEKKK